MDCQFKRQARFNSRYLIMWKYNTEIPMQHDELGKFLTQEEVKFLAEILNDAWYQIDEDNLTEEGYQLFKSIQKKLKEILNA